jgi:alpha/beta superfamily hydrolase
VSRERLLTEPAPPADAQLSYGTHASQFIEFRRSGVRGKRPLVVMIHGGFWRVRFNLAYAGHACAALSAAGFVTANIEYRRVGETGGGWPGTLDDVKLAVQFAREHAGEFDGDASRCLVLGHSAGGHLAPVPTLHQTLSDHATADFLGGTFETHPERYLAADPARPSLVPRDIVHGAEDETVPIALSRAYAAPANLIEIPGADHFAVMDPLHSAWSLVMQQVRLVER